jgi:phosphatidylglycerophosphate synthase
MKWDNYRKKAILNEYNKSVIYRVNRWVGLRFSYLFYRLGFSANLLSIFRCFLAILGFYLLSLVSSDVKYVSLIGAMIISLQVHLDFADGCIARVEGKASSFGEEVDGLANAFSRFLLIVLLGVFTENLFAIITSVFVAYFLIVFLNILIIKENVKKTFSHYSLQRFILSVPFMLVFLPTVIGMFSIYEINLIVFSFFILFLYSTLTILSFVIIKY